MRCMIAAAIVVTALILAVAWAYTSAPEAAAGQAATDYMGDADCSGVVNGNDAVHVLGALAGQEPPAPCIGAANVLCEDGLTVDDLEAILRFLGGLPVEQGGRCFSMGPAIDSDPISQGTATIHGTFSFDFDTGAETNVGADVWWENFGTAAPSHDMALQPQGDALTALLPGANYDLLNVVALNTTVYGDDPIEGPPGANDLEAGTVFAVLTDEGNYAKVRVVVSDYNLDIEWVTYSE